MSSLQKNLQKAATKYSWANLTAVHQVLLMSHGCCPVHSPTHIFEFHWFIHLGEGPAVPLHPPQAHSFLESTPVLRTAKQPPSSTPWCLPTVVLGSRAWRGSGSDMYFADVLKHMVWMPWMPWKITVTCSNPLPICWHSITFHKLLVPFSHQLCSKHRNYRQNTNPNNPYVLNKINNNQPLKQFPFKGIFLILDQTLPWDPC